MKNQIQEFRMSLSYCFYVAIGMTIGSIYGGILGGHGASPIVMIGLFIGFGAAMIFLKLKVSPEMVTLGWKKFRFAEGKITLEKLPPLLSWLNVGHGHGFAIFFTPHKGGKRKKMVFPVSKKEMENLIVLLKKYGAEA